jgi:hypothetical protein
VIASTILTDFLGFYDLAVLTQCTQV